MGVYNILTIDVEDWYHILNTAEAPTMSEWDALESHVERNMQILFDVLEKHDVQATFFWLTWIAERQKDLVRMCQARGHEIASHGHGHLIPYQAGRAAFREDVYRAKSILEDIVGMSVLGFRAPGFGITSESTWAFEVIREIGYEYDSSVFPALRSHGGMPGSPSGPHFIQTQSGPLVEFPMSTLTIPGIRLTVFGGGYLRLAPYSLIHWGFRRVNARNEPVVVYLHPREIDPEHPRLPLSFVRKFMSYVNIGSTLGKIESICSKYEFCTMRDYSHLLLEVKDQSYITINYNNSN